MPLVAPRDYSGEWLVLTRRHAPEPVPSWRYDADVQLLTTGRLEPIEEPDNYEFYSTEAGVTGLLDIAPGESREATSWIYSELPTDSRSNLIGSDPKVAASYQAFQ